MKHREALASLTHMRTSISCCQCRGDSVHYLFLFTLIAWFVVDSYIVVCGLYVVCAWCIPGKKRWLRTVGLGRVGYEKGVRKGL